MPSMSWGWILIFAIVFGLMGTPAMANRIARRRGHPRACARGGESGEWDLWRVLTVCGTVLRGPSDSRQATRIRLMRPI